MPRIQASDFEIVNSPIPGHFAVLFRGHQFAITNDRQIAEYMLLCQLKCELRYEEIRDEAAARKAAAEHKKHITYTGTNPVNTSGDMKP